MMVTFIFSGIFSSRKSVRTLGISKREFGELFFGGVTHKRVQYDMT